MSPQKLCQNNKIGCIFLLSGCTYCSPLFWQLANYFFDVPSAMCTLPSWVDCVRCRQGPSSVLSGMCSISQVHYHYSYIPGWCCASSMRLGMESGWCCSSSLVPRGWTRHSYRQGSAELGISEQPKKYFGTERKP